MRLLCRCRFLVRVVSLVLLLLTSLGQSIQSAVKQALAEHAFSTSTDIEQFAFRIGQAARISKAVLTAEPKSPHNMDNVPNPP